MRVYLLFEKSLANNICSAIVLGEITKGQKKQEPLSRCIKLFGNSYDYLKVKLFMLKSVKWGFEII